MKCPYYRQVRVTGTTPLCLGAPVSFEPSQTDLEYCTTGRHRWCPLYRDAKRELSFAVHQEVARAIG